MEYFHNNRKDTETYQQNVVTIGTNPLRSPAKVWEQSTWFQATYKQEVKNRSYANTAKDGYAVT